MVREKQLDEIRVESREFEVASFITATLRKEQERELSLQNEREQQVELPPASSPLRHCAHLDMRRLIMHGALKRSPDAFQPAFETLRRTTASSH